MHSRHAQCNRKSAIFGLQIGSFQGCLFPTAGQRNEDTGYEGEKRGLPSPRRTSIRSELLHIAFAD